ncbi:uncharacterized protein ACBT44_015047 isoform 2-T2 [Syngnathus typhle]
MPGPILHFSTLPSRGALCQGVLLELDCNARMKMLLPLLLRLTTLLLQADHPVSSGGFLSFPVKSCGLFILPPLPPPLFPPLKQRAELMVDIRANITGPKGEKGCRGARGPKGQAGVMGAEGAAGKRGSTGPSGPQGEKGYRGWRGLKGETGSPCLMMGSTGQTGLRGDKGFKGDTGPRGAPGDPGITGRCGEKGDGGLWGEPGPNGMQGSRGEPGGRGITGLKGSTGPTGKMGYPGLVGLPGLPGEPGLPGQVYVLAGQQGEPGSRGPSVPCSCTRDRTPESLPDRVQTIFIADGDTMMRKLQGENVMVLRTDKQALYIYIEAQWIDVLTDPILPIAIDNISLNGFSLSVLLLFGSRTQKVKASPLESPQYIFPTCSLHHARTSFQHFIILE